MDIFILYKMFELHNNLFEQSTLRSGSSILEMVENDRQDAQIIAPGKTPDGGV
jgi:hypothetical protein